MLKGVNRSDYSKYLLGHFIRIHLKIEKKCQFVFEKKKIQCENAYFLHVFYFQAQDACQMCELAVGMGVR